MLKKIGLIVLATIAIVLGLAAMQPSGFSVKREIAIKAGPEKIMPYLADFHQWPAWSPWENLRSAPSRGRRARCQKRPAAPMSRGQRDD